MGTRLHSIRETCSLDSELRSEDGINEIMDFTKEIKFFTRLSVLQQRSLCRFMTLEEYGPKDCVFHMGDVGDKFYIVLGGSLNIQVLSQTAPCPNDVHTEKCDCPNRPLETIGFLEKGMGFGELALQSDAPRSATIQASEKTELLVTKRKHYEMYAGREHKGWVEQRVKFLRQCPRIEDALQKGDASIADIASMANCLHEVNLTGQAMACRQGEAVDQMIFVRSGQLASLRCVDLEQVRLEEKMKSPKGLKPRLASSHENDDGSRRTSGGSDGYQPQTQLTANLAKAIMEVKRIDRRERLASLDKVDRKDSSGATQVVTEGQSAVPNAPASALKHTEDGLKGAAKGKSTWKRLQVSIKGAVVLDSFIDGAADAEGEEATSGEKGVEAAKKNVEHFASVQEARRLYTKFTFKKLSDTDKKSKHWPPTAGHRRTMRPAGVAVPSQIEATQPKRRARILRIGTLGPYEYFGDQQVTNNEPYPVSLVSDPVAEIYVMSKHDILRRVPKKLFSVLFSRERDSVPLDTELVEMHKQTERWNAFRRSMHGEALANLSARTQLSGLGRRDPTTGGSKIDAVANLDFLGVNPHSNMGESLQPLPQNKAVALTPKDEELFSQASARFLRRFDIMKRDPGLREALAVAGLMRNSRLHDSLPGSALDDDDQDPMAIRFEQHWNKLEKDPLALDDVLSEDSAKFATAVVATPTSISIADNRQSMKGRSSTMVVASETTNKRASAASSSNPPAASTGPLTATETTLGHMLSHASNTTSAAGSPEKRRPSGKQGYDAAAGGVTELPPLDSARNCKQTSRSPSAANSSARRMVGFSEA